MSTETGNIGGRRAGPRVVTVASGKGGVGKTLLSVNLGFALACAGHRVLLLDGDLGLANVNVLLGVSPPRNAGHLLSGGESFDSVVIPLRDRVDLLPAGRAIARMAELDLASQVKLLGALDLARRPYDLVVIDAGAGIGANVRLMLSLAHEVLLVTSTEVTALADAYALFKVARNAGINHPFSVVVNLVRMAGQARDTHASLDSAARTFLGEGMGYGGFVWHDRLVERAAACQRAFVECYPDAPASKCVAALARRIARRPAAGMLPRGPETGPSKGGQPCNA